VTLFGTADEIDTKKYAKKEIEYMQNITPQIILITFAKTELSISNNLL
jgi:formyltetrahydrofolate synthetase